MKSRDSEALRTIKKVVSVAAWSAVFVLSSATIAQERPSSELGPQDKELRASAQKSLRAPFLLEQPHRIEIDGVTMPNDTRVTSMLAGQIDVRPAGPPSSGRLQLVPGRVSYKRLKLSGTLPVTQSPFEWFESFRQGNLDRRSASLVILGRDLQEVQRFNIYEAMPVGFEIDIPNAQWHLTIAFEWFERA